jgi:hypothetical protein
MVFSERAVSPRRLATVTLFIAMIAGACGGTASLDFPGPVASAECAAACSGATPFCDQGSCVAACAPGLTLCASACVSTKTSNRNCGACGHACEVGEVCSLGACECPAGLVCKGGRCLP